MPRYRAKKITVPVPYEKATMRQKRSFDKNTDPYSLMWLTNQTHRFELGRVLRGQ